MPAPHRVYVDIKHQVDHGEALVFLAYSLGLAAAYFECLDEALVAQARRALADKFPDGGPALDGALAFFDASEAAHAAIENASEDDPLPIK